MTRAEIDGFLDQEWTCRVATLTPEGPHVSALWFVWDGASMWLNSTIRSQRWTDILRDPRVAVVVDTGEQFNELRGVEIKGTAGPVGEIPRTGVPCPELSKPERLFAHKYIGEERMAWDGRHGWLRITPYKITSWDFRKQR